MKNPTKRLIIDLSGKLQCFPLATDQLYRNEIDMDLCKRCLTITVYSKKLPKKETAAKLFVLYELLEKDCCFIQNGFTYVGKALQDHFQYAKCNLIAYFDNEELRYKTEKLINDYRISRKVIENIDTYLPQEELAEYGLDIGYQLLRKETMNTYTPTDLQRTEWNVEKGFTFSHADRMKYFYKQTLYDKLITYLSLNFYIENDLPRDYTKEELQKREENTEFCRMWQLKYL